jgi:hypothetical protein
MFTHLVPANARRQRRRARGTAENPPVSDACVAALSAAWHVVGREVLAIAMPGGHFNYLLPPSAADAAFLVAAAGATDRHLFYVIEAARPVYAYLDFDCAEVARYTPDTWAAAVRQCAALFGFFVDALFLGGAPAHEWRFYDASTSTKWSAHAHSRTLFASVSELAGVVARFMTWLRLRRAARDPAVKPLFFRRRSGRACIMDGAVYTERPFRLPLNRKQHDAHNWLRPAYGTAPLATHNDEVAVGFIHPPHGADATPLPTIDALLTMRRRLVAALRAPGDASTLIDAALRAVWPGGVPDARVEQEGGGELSAIERSAAAGIIELAALYYAAPLAEWPLRTQLAATARVFGGDLVASFAMQFGVAGGEPLGATDVYQACGFVALVLRAGPPADVAAAWAAWRRDAHLVLPIPENTVTLDCLRLTDRSPFDA